MNAFMKRITILVLICSVVLAACSKDASNEPEKPSDVPKGRYVEEDIKLPVKLGKGGEVYAMKRLDNGSHYLVVRTDKTVLEIYSSADDGKTWSKKDLSPTLIPKGNKISGLAVDKKGGMLIAYGVSRESDNKPSRAFESDFTYIKVDPEGKSSVLPIKVPTSEEDKKNGWFNSLHSMKFTTNGDVIGIDDSGTVYQVDMTSGKFKHTYNATGNVVSTGMAGNTLLLVTDKGVEQYDLSSGESLPQDDLLKGYLTVTGEKRPLLIEGQKEKELYFFTDKGIYRYILGGTIVEQLADGALISLNSVDLLFTLAVEKNNGGFLVLFQKITDFADVSLMSYTYSNLVQATPANEVTVFSLRENINVKQTIFSYQKANPDTKVVYEVGSSGQDAVSVADAIKKLNTEIMAGKGPDVLILDGMPLQSYIDKGLLMDLSDVLSGPLAKGELFENIVQAYKKDDKIYAAPTRFKIPFVNANKETLDKLSDLKSFAEYVDKIQAKDLGNKKLLSVNATADLFWMFYPVNAGEWVTADGVDKDKVKDFFTYTKRIYDKVIDLEKGDNTNVLNLGQAVENPNDNQYRWYKSEESGLFSMGQSTADSVALGYKELNVGFIDSFLGIADMLAPQRQYPAALFKAPTSLGGKNSYFIPAVTAGISVKTQKEAQAKSFVSYLFSKEGQGKGRENFGGLPVNKASFALGEEELDGYDAYGEELGERDKNLKYVDKKWPTKQQFDDFKRMIAPLDTPTLDNGIIFNVIAEEWDNTMTGNISVDQALDSILSKLQIYLSE